METIPITRSVYNSPEITNQATIHWKQLWSLAALYGSVIIGWIAYENYQPRLLMQFRFTDFTFLLMTAQGIILVITPMIAGRLGDRYRFENGHRLPVISSGISFAAMIFMAVAFTLLGHPGEIFRWVLPVLILFWLVAMSIFTSPALSTMELFTPVDKLPHAMAILTIVGNLVYSLEPVIVDIIDFLGAPVTFIIGGVAVFLSGYALRKNSLGLFRLTDNREPERSATTRGKKSQYLFIFFPGLIVGLATTILFDFFPAILESKLNAVFHTDGKIMIVAMLVLSAMLSWPLSYAVNKYGMSRVFWLSFMVIAVSTLAILFLAASVWILIMSLVFTLAYTSLSVSALPLAINRSGFSEKVFCVGLFFSAVALPGGLWESYLAYGV
jgi:MFS family permease